MNEHPSELFWARYLGGEIGFLGRLRLSWHLRRCSRCAREHQEMMREKQAFDVSPDRLADIEVLRTRGSGSLRQKPAPSFLERHSFSVGIPALAAAALALLIVLIPKEPEEDLRTKGNDSFVLFVKKDRGGAEVLGERCHPGDQIRARYETARPYLIIVGMDASGETTILFPMGSERSGRVSTTPAFTPGSWILDERLGKERFIAIFSDEPVKGEDAIRALSAAGSRTPGLLHAVVVESGCIKVAP